MHEMQDFAWVWKAILIVVGGTVLLRIAGRKSISQMTLTQTVIMIGIGSLLVQPLAGKNIWITLSVGLLLVLTLIVMEYIQLKFDFFEKLVTGSSKVIIHNGRLHEKNMKKLRFTVDILETQLRQNNISSISDVKWATLEPNGRIGFQLKDNAAAATKADIALLRQELTDLRQLLDERLPYAKLITQTGNMAAPLKQLDEQMKELSRQLAQMRKDDLFTEVNNSKHRTPPPKNLQ